MPLLSPRFRALVRLPAAVLLALPVAASCSSGGSSASGCSAPVHDAFDPRSAFHILPGVTPPPYLTDPPTSGEHQPVNTATWRGIRTSPITPQVQVALLESGQVVVQYRSPADAAALTPLVADALVTLAPNPALPAPIAATAWLWRLQCAAGPAGALPAIRSFIHAHEAHGPQAPPPR